MDVKPVAEDVADVVANGAAALQQRPQGLQVLVPEWRVFRGSRL